MNEHVYTFALQKLVGAPRSLWAVRRNPHMQGLPLLHELGPRPTLSPPLEPRAKDGARRKCPHSPHPTVASSGPETRRRASLRRRCRTVPATFPYPAFVEINNSSRRRPPKSFFKMAPRFSSVLP